MSISFHDSLWGEVDHSNKDGTTVYQKRLNGDVHERLNDVVTVPNLNLPKSLTGEQTGIF